MTMTEHSPEPVVTEGPAPLPVFEPCDQCQAPLDERQRYCVVCGTHRPNADDPVARYLAQSRRLRTAPPAPQQPRSGGARLAAAIALIPLAAALGVLVGRGDSGDSARVLDALKVQKAPVVNVVGGAGDATASGTPAADAGATGATAGPSPTAGVRPGAVVARTTYGTARKLEGAKPTARQVQESRQALKKIIQAKGKDYVESQRGLPDQIVIP